MAQQYGYSGSILRVDLSTRKTTAVPTENYADRFLGGRGIGTKIYWDEVPPGIGPLDPENKLIIMTGPLCGFGRLAGSMWQIYAKSPLYGQFCYATLGGHWGANLKLAGYDGAIIQGRSDVPVFIFAHDDEVEIRDASHLIGRGALDVRQILKQELGDSVKVLAVGPAGDNLVPFANVVCESDSSASSGFGAVMGSKRLKAIVVKGNRKLFAARPEELRDLTKHVFHLNNNKLGIPMLPYIPPPSGVRLKKYPCYGCVPYCARGIVETSDGKISKRFCQSSHYYQEQVRGYYGAYNDVVYRATMLANQNGIDTRTLETIMEWLTKCYRAGILTDQNTGIPLSKLGSLEYIETLLEKIALRQGFGEPLSRGVIEAAKAVGRGAEKLVTGAYTIEGAALAFDPRTYITTSLIHAMEPRQAISQITEIGLTLSLWMGWTYRDQPVDNFKVGSPHPQFRGVIEDPQAVKTAMDACYVSTEVLKKIARTFWGGEIAADFSTYEGKALAVKRIQDRTYAKESSTLCFLAWPILHTRVTGDHVGDPTLEGRLLSAVTGRDIDEDGFNRIGERVFNLQRLIRAREGRKGRQTDSLPDFCFTTPIEAEGYNTGCLVPGKGGAIVSRKGSMLDREKFEEMKNEYYRLRGWDVTTGLQTRTKLEELGLSDVVGEAERRRVISS